MASILDPRAKICAVIQKLSIDLHSPSFSLPALFCLYFHGHRTYWEYFHLWIMIDSATCLRAGSNICGVCVICSKFQVTYIIILDMCDFPPDSQGDIGIMNTPTDLNVFSTI